MRKQPQERGEGVGALAGAPLAAAARPCARLGGEGHEGRRRAPHHSGSRGQRLVRCAQNENRWANLQLTYCVTRLGFLNHNTTVMAFGRFEAQAGCNHGVDTCFAGSLVAAGSSWTVHSPQLPSYHADAIV